MLSHKNRHTKKVKYLSLGAPVHRVMIKKNKSDVQKQVKFWNFEFLQFFLYSFEDSNKTSLRKIVLKSVKMQTKSYSKISIQRKILWGGIEAKYVFFVQKRIITDP